MNDKAKIEALRNALMLTGCTYINLNKVPEENFGKAETPEMHRIWCLKCRVLHETK